MYLFFTKGWFTFLPLYFVDFKLLVFHVLCEELRVQFVLAPSAFKEVADGQQDKNIARPHLLHNFIKHHEIT